MSWFILTLISALTGSLTKVFQKILLKDDQNDSFAFSFVFQFLVAILFFIYCLVTHSIEFPNLTDLWLNLIILTVFYSLGNVLTFFAFKLAPASEVAIIYSSNTIWVIVSAVLFLEESIKLQHIFGIILIILGLFAVNYTRSKWQFNRGHLFGLIGAMLFGFAFTNDAFIINRYHNVAAYMIPAFLLPGIMTLLIRPSAVKHVGYFLNLKILIKLMICAVFYALSAIAIFTAYKMGAQASIISPIHQSSIFITVILSYIFLKETDKLPQKITGSILAFIGVVLMV